MKLSPTPTIHPSAVVRQSQLGVWTQVAQHTLLEESSLGDYSYIMEYCQVVHSQIGKFCSIASMVRLNPGNHPIDRPTSHHLTYRASMFDLGPDESKFFAWRAAQPVVVGHDVWIGHGATVLPGVIVGNGAVIGTAAVVTKDVAPYSIVVGVPAKPLRQRFSSALVERLEALAWWDWPHDRLRECLADLRGSAEAFVEKYGR